MEGVDVVDLEQLVQQHRNGVFSSENAYTSVESALREPSLACTGYDFSISDEDIGDLERAHERIVGLVDDRFRKLTFMARKRQANLLKYGHTNMLSLGFDCLSRTVPARWGLKRTARLGESTMPFDLAVHQPLTVETLLDSDFDDYLSAEHLVFSEELNFCSNVKYRTNFNHETGPEYAASDFEALRATYTRRIRNMYAVINDPRPLCLVAHSPSFMAGEEEQKQSLRRILDSISGRRSGPTGLVAFNTHSVDSGAQPTGVREAGFRWVNTVLPFEDHVWHLPESFLSDPGFEFELTMARELADALDELLPSD